MGQAPVFVLQIYDDYTTTTTFTYMDIYENVVGEVCLNTYKI